MIHASPNNSWYPSNMNLIVVKVEVLSGSYIVWIGVRAWCCASKTRVLPYKYSIVCVFRQKPCCIKFPHASVAHHISNLAPSEFLCYMQNSTATCNLTVPFPKFPPSTKSLNNSLALVATYLVSALNRRKSNFQRRAAVNQRRFNPRSCLYASLLSAWSWEGCCEWIGTWWTY